MTSYALTVLCTQS